MKIFNKENEKDKVYVQMNDLMMLNQSNLTIPVSIFEKVFSGTVIVDDDNRMDFVEFSDPNEIEFFKNIDWILDFKEINSLKREEVEKRIAKDIETLNDIANRFSEMTEDERRENQNLIIDFDLMQYKIAYYSEIIAIQEGTKEMPFPLVPDSSGFNIEEETYKFSASLDPNKLLLYKKNGETISRNDSVPQNFLFSSISIATMENNKQGLYDAKYSLSEDNKYLIVSIMPKKQKDNDDDYNENIDSNEKKENKIRKMLKKVFKRNKN